MFLIINEVFYVTVVDGHDTWFYCWWWKLVIKILMDFSNSASVIFFHFYLQIIPIPQHLLYFFPMRIDNMSLIIDIVHSIDLVIWLFKSVWVYFGSMTKSFSLRMSWSGYIRAFFKSVGLYPFLWLFVCVCVCVC